MISLDDEVVNANGQFVALKCEHVSCIECARKSTHREMEEMEHIPSCPVCPESITVDDLIVIWGKQRAQQMMDTLFKRKSLRVPPYRPDLAAGYLPEPQSEPDLEQNRPDLAAGYVPEEIDEPLRDDVVDQRPPREPHPEPHSEPHPEPDRPEQPDQPMEEQPEPEQPDILKDDVVDQIDIKNDDEYGHCLTPECHRKNPLKGTRLDCSGCGISWCVRCGVEWHLGETCEQYQTAAAMAMEQQYGNGMVGGMEDQQFQAMYDQNYNQDQWRTCRLCLSVIEKDGGCNHMTCPCGHHFCWLCDQDVDPENLDKHYEIGMCALNEEANVVNGV